MHSYTDIEIPAKDIRGSSAIEIANLAARRWMEFTDEYFDYINLDKAIMLKGAGPSTKEAALGFFQSNTQYKLSTGGVIPVYKKEDVKEVTRTVTVDLTKEEVEALRGSGVMAYQRYSITRKILEAGGDNYGFDYCFTLPKPRKPVATSTEGKLKTVYVLRREGGYDSFYTDRRTYRLSTEYDTLAEAKRAAVEILKEYGEKSPNLGDLIVQSYTVRVGEGGNQSKALATISIPERSIRQKFTYKTEIPKKGAKADSYLVTFDFHS